MKAAARVASILLICTALSAPALAQESRKDLQIFKDISDAVLKYPRFTVFDDVGASIDQGSVTLTGKVTMGFKRSDIERIVARIAGVTHVDNKITLLPVSQFDDDLRFGIARAIYGSSTFWPYATMVNPPIHIIVENGRVTLTGVVNSEVERMLARSLASGFPAFSVKSELKTDQEVKNALEKIGM